MENERFKGKPWNPDQEKYFGGVFGSRTLLTLYYFSNKGLVWQLHGEVSRGKEAAVFVAETKTGRFIAVKIFRPIPSFDMKAYILGDPRFKGFKKSKLIETWANKEFKNLSRFEHLGVRVPSPIQVRENVLLMEFIGKGSVPAPTYKDCPPKNPVLAFKKVVDYMKKAHAGGIVHGDLSEYNILDYLGPVWIDCGQAVINRHPKYLEYLDRDIRNVVRFFSKLGVKCDPDSVRKEVLG